MSLHKERWRPEPTVSVIIVNYNTDRLLFRCLESLSQHKEAAVFEVVVINNGMRLEPSAVAVKGLAVRLVNNPRNNGYAAALNQGIALTHAPFVLCLNADTSLPPGSIRALTRHLEGDRDIGLAAPQLRYPNGDLQYSCRRDYSWSSIASRRLPHLGVRVFDRALRDHLMLDQDHERTLEPDWVLGSCMMIPRSLLSQLGGFDERFFLYFEDYDLCQRIRGRGLKIAYLPESKVVHHYPRSSRAPLRREFWNHVASALKYWARPQRVAGPPTEALSGGV